MVVLNWWQISTCNLHSRCITECDNFRGVLCVYRKGQPKCIFTMHYEWTEKFHPKSFSYYHQKAAFASEKLLSSIETLFFYSHCRWRSKLKYILLCNEDIIKMWSHKRENYYNHCNRCPVYSADCITPCKAKLWYMPLLPTTDNSFDISWEMTSSGTLYLWTICCQDWSLSWKSPLEC